MLYQIRCCLFLYSSEVHKPLPDQTLKKCIKFCLGATKKMEEDFEIMRGRKKGEFID